MRTFLLIILTLTFSSCSHFNGSNSCGLDAMVFLLDTTTLQVHDTGLKLPSGQDVNEFNSVIVLNNQKKSVRFPLLNADHKIVATKLVSSHDGKHGTARYYSDNWETTQERTYYEIKGESQDTLLIPKFNNLDSLVYEFTYLYDTTQLTRLVSLENVFEKK